MNNKNELDLGRSPCNFFTSYARKLKTRSEFDSSRHSKMPKKQYRSILHQIESPVS